VIRPPIRCPRCNAYDAWEELPRPVRNAYPPTFAPVLAGVSYEDWWTCGICGLVYRVPLPSPPLTLLPELEP